jgi:hypothetical protein
LATIGGFFIINVIYMYKQSKFKSQILVGNASNLEFKPKDTPPYSVPDVTIPNIEVHDDLLDPDLHKQVWEYVLNSTWHHVVEARPSELQIYRPSDWDDSWIRSLVLSRGLSMPRALYASDEASLIKKHPILHELWNKINERLGNKYDITGVAEGTKWKEYPVPPPTDPSLPKGWRVYANATVHDAINGNGYVHRDTPDLYDDTTATIIYMVTPEWYPSWGGEIIFYPEDPNGLTGDHQQFNGGGQQQRNFKIGWADAGRMVSLKPNRLLVYDGRTLHSSTASRHHYNTEFQRRVVFRARLKTN